MLRPFGTLQLLLSYDPVPWVRVANHLQVGFCPGGPLATMQAKSSLSHSAVASGALDLHPSAATMRGISSPTAFFCTVTSLQEDAMCDMMPFDGTAELSGLPCSTARPTHLGLLYDHCIIPGFLCFFLIPLICLHCSQLLRLVGKARVAGWADHQGRKKWRGEESPANLEVMSL